MAEKNNIQALSILSVSDNVITHTTTSPGDREPAKTEMIALAMGLA